MPDQDTAELVRALNGLLDAVQALKDDVSALTTGRDRTARVDSPAAPQPVVTDYLPVKDAAAELGVSVRTVYDWLASGKVPFKVTPGGERRVRVEDCLLDPPAVRLAPPRPRKVRGTMRTLVDQMEEERRSGA